MNKSGPKPQAEYRCGKCGELDASKFSPTYRTTCNPCLAAWQRAYRRRRPKDYWQTKDKKYALKKRYGITIEQFEKMAAEQDWKCAVCGVDPRLVELSQRGFLHVDHCHTTGAVRGLLCNGCNRALGLINERPGVAIALAAYIEKHSSRG